LLERGGEFISRAVDIGEVAGRSKGEDHADDDVRLAFGGVGSHH